MIEPQNPMRAAQANMRPAPVRRFYRTVSLSETEGGWALSLDGRAARTPGRNRLAAASRPLMLRVAEEWRRQGETLDPADMPITRLLNAAIDGVARAMEETRAEILRYAGSDLVCYRALEPETLAERQRQAFDQVLDWAAEALGARFALAGGVMPVPQSPETLAAVRAALDRVEDPAALAALSAVTTLTGSATLALATAAGFLSAAEAWRAAHVDEDFQSETWGVDAEAAARRAARWREMEGAAAALAALRDGSSRKE
ncbi:MAG TPA: ATP12 family protein [Roseiarcus sp.]|nr:ATP12 family protein [Roseiarcus sp.]